MKKGSGGNERQVDALWCKWMNGRIRDERVGCDDFVSL